MTQRTNGRSFFATLPGVFTGLVSLIGAGSALYVALYQNPRSEGSLPSIDTAAMSESSEPVQHGQTAPPGTREGAGQMAPAANDPKKESGRVPALAVDPRRLATADVKRVPAVANGVSGTWRFSERWAQGTDGCDVGGVYQFEQIGSEFGGRYSQESDCAGDTDGIVTDGFVSGYDVRFVIPSDEVICVYEGVVSGWPANRIDGTAVCGDAESFVVGQWSARRDMGR